MKLLYFDENCLIADILDGIYSIISGSKVSLLSTMKQAGSTKQCGLTLFMVFYLVTLALTDNNRESNLRDALRNNTRYEQSNERNEDGAEVLKNESQKFLKQCGGTRNQSNNNSNNRHGSGTGSERNYANRQTSNKGYGSNLNEDRFGSRNSNGQSGSSWDSSNNDGDWNINSFSNGNPDRNRPKNSDQYGQNPNNGFRDFYGPSSKNPSSSFRFNQADRQHDYEPWTQSRGDQASSSNDYNIRRGYDGNLGFNRPTNEECRDQGNGNLPRSSFGSNQPRSLRSSYFNREDERDEDENDCISQCVLGYMHLLDADRSPSETLTIKWLQEHVTKNEMDRIKALRDTRKCFGKLVTTDIEDGCEYAKELSKCLELDLE